MMIVREMVARSEVEPVVDTADPQGKQADTAVVMPTQHRQPRYTGMDALRGIAASIVVLYHFTWMYQAYFGFPEPVPYLIRGGGEAVCLFFIISGFVILMSAERVSSSKDFLVSRAIRLYPAYWVCLLTTFAVVKILGFPGRESSVARLLVNVTMFQGFVGVGNVENAYWSLAFELCFYLWIGILLAFRKLHFLPAALILFMLIGPLLLRVIPPTPETDGPKYLSVRHFVELMLLTNYVNFFAAGTALYLIMSGRLRTGLILVTAALAYSVLTSPWNDVIVAMVLFAIVAGAVRLQPRWLSNRIFLYFGAISYPLYLIHGNIGAAIIRRLLACRVGSYTCVGVAVVTSILLATVVTYGIERRILKRLRPSKPVVRTASTS